MSAQTLAQGASLTLEGRNLAFSFGTRRVLQDASVCVRSGEVISLLGRNGAGKTTLLRVLLGLDQPQSGEVLLQGRSLRTLGRREIAQALAYLPQHHTPPFPYSVREVVMLGRIPAAGIFRSFSQADRELAQASLDRLHLGDLADRIYTRLSGGERQLVLIARALTQGAQVLVMDEPATGLDYGNQQRLLECLCQLAASGLAILLSTHHPEHALRASTRVALLVDGRITAEGSPERIITPETIRGLYGIDVDMLRSPAGAIGMCPVGHAAGLRA